MPQRDLRNGPNHLKAADVNGDGHVDVLTANRGDFDFSQRRAVGGGTISVLFGNGSVALAPPVELDVLDSATGLALGDLNGDGAPEIIGVAHDGDRLVAFFQRP